MSSNDGARANGGSWLEDVMAGMLRGPTEADVQAAVKRVDTLRAKRQGRSTDDLVRDVIKGTARRSAAVGAATAGTALVPGLGTLAAMTIGTATDVGATLRLQTQMVLDIAVLRGAELSTQEARNVVLLVAGVSTASTAALNRAGRVAAMRLGERFTARWVLRAVPVIGMLSSSGTNALATRVIGHRADAYFSLGPEAMGDWAESVRAVIGVDERPLWRRLTSRRPKQVPGPRALPAPREQEHGPTPADAADDRST
ncbi:hypothetical protein BH23DEI1_BH23DEI1_10270 [soil metagenome]|nr:hypothetical protein [Trueperaceae bacterium]